MILQTGKRNENNRLRANKAFTLIEIMVSISILSLGLVVILQWFSHSLNILRISQNYTKATLLLENKIADIEIKFKEGAEETGGSEEFEDSNILFKSRTEAMPVECKKELDSGQEMEYGDLYKIKAVLSWKEGRRKGSISLVTYLNSNTVDNESL